MRNKKVKVIAYLAILIAVEVVLSIVSNYINIAGVNINLGLIPIAIAAAMFGVLGGLTLGIVNGIVVILSPSTGAFLAGTVIGTIITCISKTGLAGVASALVYKAFEKKREVLGSILASIVIPIVNTLVFTICCFIFFRSLFGAEGLNNAEYLKTLFVGFVTVNFVIEMSISSLLSTTSYRVIRVKNRK